MSKSCVLYYSNSCASSKQVLVRLSRSALAQSQIHFICVDNRSKRTNAKGDSVWIIHLPNGSTIPLPEHVTKVPALMLLSDSKVLVHDQLDQYLQQMLMMEQKYGTQQNWTPMSHNVNPGMNPGMVQQQPYMGAVPNAAFQQQQQQQQRGMGGAGGGGGGLGTFTPRMQAPVQYDTMGQLLPAWMVGTTADHLEAAAEGKWSGISDLFSYVDINGPIAKQMHQFSAVDAPSVDSRTMQQYVYQSSHSGSERIREGDVNTDHLKQLRNQEITQVTPPNPFLGGRPNDVMATSYSPQIRY